MKNKRRRIMITLALASCFGMVAAGCVVRAEGRVRPVYVVDEQPPPPRSEVPQSRAGYVWVSGRWEYRNGRWVWQQGRLIEARSGQTWQAGHWERRGNRWHWVEGRWVAGGGVEVRDHRRPAPPPKAQPAPQPQPGPTVRDHRRPAPYPTQAPPARRAEQPGSKAGYVWIAGRWQWENGNWEWQNGRWERARANHEWESGRWERQGDRYVWVEGRWVKGVQVRDHRKKKDPPPADDVPVERVPARRGR